MISRGLLFAHISKQTGLLLTTFPIIRNVMMFQDLLPMPGALYLIGKAKMLLAMPAHKDSYCLSGKQNNTLRLLKMSY